MVQRKRPQVWLFDLDDTLHDAAGAAMPGINAGMNDYIMRRLGLDAAGAQSLRRQYFLRYGATLLGLIRHHGVDARHFLHETHRLPGLEQRLRAHAPDLAALRRLPGRKYILTNAPAAYAGRVLGALGLHRTAAPFDGVITIEQMSMFGRLRPKPDARMLRRLAARLKVAPARCTLVEDTLVHQRAARRIGMATAWMQRWQAPQRLSHSRPAYVDLRVRALLALRR